MPLFSRIPLAWLNLAHRPMRFLVFLAGIGFAVLLMFVQLGFWLALLESVSAVINHFNTDLVIINQAKTVLDMPEPFPLRQLVEARAVPGVAEAIPLYVRMGPWKGPNSATQEAAPACGGARRKVQGSGGRAEPPHPSRQLIRVLASDPSADAMLFPEVIEQARQLRMPEVALCDSLSKRALYGMPTEEPFDPRDRPFTGELCDRRIRVIGSFTLGTDFSADGNLIMSDQNFVQYFAGQTTLQDVEIGLIRVKDTQDVYQVKEALQDRLPGYLLVLTREEYAGKERQHWQTSTPVGFIFSLGLVVGFVVGVTICSQILSSDVSDHLPEYATLKAIGYTNSYLTRVVLQEALLLSILGFLPGLVLSHFVYLWLRKLTGLPLHLTFVWSMVVLGITIVMCVLSGFLSVGKVWKTDPAEVFR